MRLSVTLIALLAAHATLAAQPCDPERFQHDSFVCTCTASYCDTLDPIQRTPQGVAQIYESARDSNKRFTRYDQAFNTTGGIPNWIVNVERANRKHEVQGFGVSFSDSAAIVIGALPPAQQRTIYESYFADTGIELVFGRVTISGSDFSTRPYSYDDGHPDDFDLQFFALQPEDTVYKIPQLKLATEVAAHQTKWFGSSWSPPAWMKTNNMLNGTGSLKEYAGSIYWETYAKYLVRFLDEYKAAGVDMWGLTIQNEPSTWGDHPWNSCAFNSTMERDLIKFHLGPNLERAGYTPDRLKLMMLDHNRYDVPDWVAAIYDDPEANKYVSGAAVHWYFNGQYGPELFDEIMARYPDKFFLYTEASMVSNLDVIGLGEWYIAEQYFQDIMDDVTHSVMGWVDWNLALDMEGGPNWSISHRSAPIHVDAAAGKWYKNPCFYAIGHFSKFVSPGSRHLGSLVGNNQVKIGVFERPDGGIAVIALNAMDQAQSVLVQDPERGTLRVEVGPKSFNSWLYY